MSNTFDDYISAYLDGYEICFGLYHGRGHWDFWQDTGYEFVEDEGVELVFQEALDEEGNLVVVSKELIDKAEAIASERYWERYADGYYNG